MKFLVSFLIVLFVPAAALLAQQVKVVGECTITFHLSSNNANTNSNLAGAVKTLYVKGRQTRVDLVSPAINQVTIYNNTTGDAVILKEVGGEKFMMKVDAQKWRAQNARFDGQKITYTNDTKTILGYECKKGVVTGKDGSVLFNFYYNASMTLSAGENPFQFKDIPGVVLEYEMIDKDTKISVTYTATVINFNPVPSVKFEIPSSGYRVLPSE